MGVGKILLKGNGDNFINTGCEVTKKKKMYVIQEIILLLLLLSNQDSSSSMPNLIKYYIFKTGWEEAAIFVSLKTERQIIRTVG